LGDVPRPEWKFDRVGGGRALESAFPCQFKR
jgi:hypothetical protein